VTELSGQIDSFGKNRPCGALNEEKKRKEKEKKRKRKKKREREKEKTENFRSESTYPARLLAARRLAQSLRCRSTPGGCPESFPGGQDAGSKPRKRPPLSRSREARSNHGGEYGLSLEKKSRRRGADAQ